MSNSRFKFRMWASNDLNPNGRMYYPEDQIEVGIGNYKANHVPIISFHGDLWETVNSLVTTIDSEKGLGRIRWIMSEVELMQLTGLKDKNGKDIWESDVVRIIDLSTRPKPYIGAVIWNDVIAGFEALSERGFGLFLHNDKPFKNAIPELQKFTGDGSNRTIEVIGNIYENPELLTI